VVRRLDMDKAQGIEQLLASGMSNRQVARTLGINRKSVDRHLTAIRSKGATATEAPTGETLTGAHDSKGPKRPPGPTGRRYYRGHTYFLFSYLSDCVISSEQDKSLSEYLFSFSH
jgi:hypothetical protein